MKIKRFFAAEMRDAIRQVKNELGADAVILSNNKVDGGIELVAAIDYDEDAVHRSLQSQNQGQEHTQNTSSVSPFKQQRRGSVGRKSVNKSTHKKRAIFSRKTTEATPAPATHLADAIQDDVINFSGQQHKQYGQQSKARLTSQSTDFADLLKESAKQQRQTSQGAYTKPAIQERKQPFISDFELSNSSDTSIASDNDLLGYDSRGYSTDNEQDLDDFFSLGDTGSKRAVNDRKNQNKSSYRDNRKKASAKMEWVQDPALTSMQEEIKSLRGILENQLSGLAWGSFSRDNPHSAELLSRLYRLGIKSSLSEKIVKQLKNSEEKSLEDNWRRVLSIIARNLPMAKTDLLDEGGVIALVGPTGVGKSTNIAKLAARFTLKYGAKNLALVTTDSYRIGAHEQLKTYGRILGVPVYVANDDEELRQILSRLDDKQLVLIDTAGMSPRDLRLTQQLSMLRHSHEQIKILAVLSASTQTLAMDEVIQTLNARELDGCIASKVDESTSIGGIISILIENQLQLNYISDGQKVPEDIHRANTTDLLKQALEMVRQHPVSVNEDELAMSYSTGGLAHAVG